MLINVSEQKQYQRLCFSVPIVTVIIIISKILLLPNVKKSINIRATFQVEGRYSNNASAVILIYNVLST